MSETVTETVVRAMEGPSSDASADALVAKGQQIMDKAVLLILVKGTFSNQRTLGREIVQTNAEKQMLALTKKLTDSFELRDVLAIDRQAKVYLDAICLPSPFRWGVYLVPLAAVERVNSRLQELGEKRLEMVEKFIGAYDKVKADSKVKLADLYREQDYPTVDGVRRSFQFKWQFVSFNVPTSLEAVSAELFAQERDKARTQLASAVQDIQLAMREGLKQMVDHMVERLTPGEDGKPKMLIKGFGTDLAEWLGNFDLRNITNDDELAVVVAEARKLARGVDIDIMRKDPMARDSIAKGFAAIQENLGTMIVDVERGRRAISFDED